jgi:hypothetical protein
MLPWAGRGDREQGWRDLLIQVTLPCAATAPCVRDGYVSKARIAAGIRRRASPGPIARTVCPNCGAGKLKIIAAVLRVSPDANGPEDRFWRAADHLGFS